MRAAIMAWRWLAREWRYGELAVLLLALSVAVGALCGVGFLVDRIGRAVDLQAAEVLAADVRVESERPLAAAAADAARVRGLATATRTLLLSVIYAGEASQLTNLQAVSDGYPLRGALKVAGQPFATGHNERAIPAPGEAWPDSRLAAALGVRPGGTLVVGKSTLRVTRILISRPDQGASFVEFAATLLMNAADLEATGLLQPGSRVEYALLVAGERRAVRSFADWQRAHARAGERIADVTDGSPQTGQAALRAGRFLTLASLVAVLLCAIAVAMSARSYVRRHLDAVALLKTLGASRRFVLTVTLTELGLLALIASVVGALLGWITQAWLLCVLRGWLNADLPAPGFAPALIGLAVALVMLAGFALPSLISLTRVPAMRVLRRDAGPPPPAFWWALLPAVAGVVAVVYGTLADLRLSAWFLAAMAAAVALLALTGLLLVTLAARVRGATGISWRYGLANLGRRRAESVVQIVAFGLGALLLLTLAILRRDLVSDWQHLLPGNPPNYFFVNIPAAQREQFRAELEAQGARVERMLPQVRGRLLAINGEPVRPSDDNRRGAASGGAASGGEARSGRGGFLANREQNLTWSAELGDDNRIVAGHWWTPADHGQPLVSLATEFQERLGLKLGDRLVFDVAGESFEVRVASFRAVKWDSFRPNFFIVFPPGLLDDVAGTYMTSAAFEPRSAAAMATLVHRYPTVSIFNVADLLTQVRAVIAKAVAAVQSVFLFTLVAGLTVLFAAVQSSRDERALETAVLRALGASRATVRRAVLVEFAALGAVAGLLASSAAAVAGYGLASALDLRYRFDALLWVLGLLCTVAVAVYGGWLSTRRLLRESPRVVLR